MYICGVMDSSQSEKVLLARIGDKLKSLRLAANISQVELANRCGLSRTSISEIEKGKNMTISTLISILRQLKQLDLLHDLVTIENPSLTPLQLYELERNKRKRARTK